MVVYKERKQADQLTRYKTRDRKPHHAYLFSDLLEPQLMDEHHSLVDTQSANATRHRTQKVQDIQILELQRDTAEEKSNGAHDHAIKLDLELGNSFAVQKQPQQRHGHDTEG